MKKLINAVMSARKRTKIQSSHFRIKAGKDAIRGLGGERARKRRERLGLV